MTEDTRTAMPPAPDPAPPARRRRIRWPRLGGRRTVVAAGAAAVVGIFVAGFGLGWTSGRLTGPDELPDTTVEVVAAPPAEGAEIPLPDVRGLLLVDAQQAMVDAGLSPDAVTVVEAPGALPAGTILRQDPVGGTGGAAAVTLYVSVPGTVPDVVGTDAEDAVQVLRDLGSTVRQVARYSPGTPEGTVLAVEPAAGSPLPQEAVLTVSGPASSIFLAQVDRAQGSCNSGEAPVDGRPYDNSVLCSPGTSESTTAWLLDRQVSSLEGVVGLADSSDPAATARVRIAVDDRVLLDTEVAYGATTPIALDVTGGLRLTVTYSTANRSSTGRLVLGDVRLVGDPAGIDALDQQ